MGIHRKVIILLTILLLITACSKEKLDGDYAFLVGTWKRTGGWNDGATNNYLLSLEESGNYELFDGSLKIDHGSLREDRGYLMLVSASGHKHQYERYDHLYLGSTTDSTLVITCIDFTDCQTSTYLKID